jgi:hypothetical protein
MGAARAFFISYAHEDLSYVTALTAHLRSFGLPVWFDVDLR